MRFHLSRAAQELLHFLRIVRYRRRFNELGPGFNPRGDFILVNEGVLKAGCDFGLRSFPYHPVQIRVGKQGHLTFGDGVGINQGARITCTREIVIGDDCMIADEVLIMDTDWHGVGDEPARTEAVIIEKGVWIATRAVILRGVTLGEGCIVAAGAVVTRSVEPFTLVAGVPAQAIRKINPAPCAGYRGR